MRKLSYIKNVIFVIVFMCMIVWIDGFVYYAAVMLPHEAAHFASAALLGYRISGFEITPFGFNLNLKEEFIKPLDDLIISISGPLINFIFFAITGVINFNSEILGEIERANMILLIFNLLPGGFLDGGRLLKTLLRSYVSFYKAYVISSLNGVVLGCIISLSSFAAAGNLQRIIIFTVGCLLTAASILGLKGIIVKVIGDTIHKSVYFQESNYCKIVYSFISENAKLIDIIKHFCFNKYYIIHIKENIDLSFPIKETEIIRIYCSRGNITLHEAAKYLQEE